MHMVLFTWWCWHIYKGEGVGVSVDQLVGKRNDGRTVRSSWADGPTLLGGRSASIIQFCPERLQLYLGLKAVLQTVRYWGADSPQVF